MGTPAAGDPADLIVAWEAVEELLGVVPEGASKQVLRLMAAGLADYEIAERLGIAAGDVPALAARGRVRILTAAIPAPG